MRRRCMPLGNASKTSSRFIAAPPAAPAALSSIPAPSIATMRRETDQPSGIDVRPVQDLLAAFVQNDATHAPAAMTRRQPPASATTTRTRDVRKRSDHGRRPSARKEVRPGHARNTAEARKQSAHGASRRPPLRPAQRNNTGRTTARRPGGRPARDDAKWEREERVARHRSTAEQRSKDRPGRTRTPRNTTTLPRVDPPNCRGRAGGSNRGRYSPQCATALAGSPKPLEPTQLLIRSPRRRGRGASAGW